MLSRAFVPSITHDHLVITPVLTFYHVTRTQAPTLERERFDFHQKHLALSISPTPRNLWLLLEVSLSERQQVDSQFTLNDRLNAAIRISATCSPRIILWRRTRISGVALI